MRSLSSRDLTKADPTEDGNLPGGPVFTDKQLFRNLWHSHAYFRESDNSAVHGTIWAGTDDGNIQVTSNGGGQWTNVAANLKEIAARFARVRIGNLSRECQRCLCRLRPAHAGRHASPPFQDHGWWKDVERAL